ncbi:hypothetical protein [Halorussus caseinilyticus]|uniref:hypothetical protein n=1 Tax=Halorussus caseinilyticus TaxID=3034025 RepID=UPI0023E8D82E|nr:hypothetical protein [Halorussus sp. DT72]
MSLSDRERVGAFEKVIVVLVPAVRSERAGAFEEVTVVLVPVEAIRSERPQNPSSKTPDFGRVIARILLSLSLHRAYRKMVK